MITFRCDKLARDNTIERMEKEGVILHYRIISGHKLREALLKKMVEEAQEVHDSVDHQEVIDELADVLEVIDGICKAYDISMNDVRAAKEQKHQTRGGFEKGVYIETFELAEDNPKTSYFRSQPEKYIEEK